MKGLLLKDLYMLRKYSASYILILVVFSAVSLFGDGNMFFTIYPVIFAGILPVNLLSYDEKSKWISYGMTFPYSRSQMVSAKYIMSLIILFAAMAYILIVQMLKYFAFDSDMGVFFNILPIMIICGVIPQVLMLPIVFRVGVEKGRLGYMIMIFVVCAAIPIINEMTDVLIYNIYNYIFVGAVVFAVVAYIFSWLISIKFFKNRDL